jgi:outer membrane lipoprotein SlyB
MSTTIDRSLGPGIVGALGGAAIGGFVGITVGCLLAAMVGVAMYRRTERPTGC